MKANDPALHQEAYPFLSGGGEMGELIRSMNWAAHPLGSPAGWHAALKQTVSMMLKNSFPVLICWGPDYIQLYNDAFRPINGKAKHPRAMGGSARDTYAEIWQTIGPMFAEVMQGRTHGFPNFMVPLDRNGYPEDCYFDFSYSPIADLEGNIRGVLVICMETTEKIKALEYQEIQQQNIRNMVRQAPVGMCLVKGEPLMVEEINDLFLEIIGKKREMFGNVPYWEVIAEAAPFYRPVTDRVMATGETYHANEHEITLIRQGKPETVFVDFVYEPMKDAGGKTEAIMIVAIEVTEKVIARRQVEEGADELQAMNEEMAASNEELSTTNEELIEIQQQLGKTNQELAASSSRLRMAIESTGLGTWEYEPVSGELYWSKECRAIYGLPEDRQPTMEIFAEHIHPDDRAWVQEQIEASMRPGQNGRYDLSYRIIRFDNGETRWIKVQGIVYFDRAKATSFIGTVLDITEMKLAEEKSAKLAAIITSSDDAIVSKTLESVITSWNDSAQRMFGYTAEEMIGETIYKLIPPDRHEEEPLILSRLKSGERVEHFETKRRTKDGRLIDVSVTVSPMKDSEGKIIGLSKIARDITERKQDEVRKNDFIGMVSHELKTPLTSLTAILQVLQSKLRKSEDAFVPGALEKANLQVKKMSKMINGFLNISRLESGKILIDKQSFVIGDLVKEIMGETSLSSPTHLFELHTCDKAVVRADRDKLGSVLSNLLSNAVKYSPKGSRIQVNCQKLESEIRISVTDEGLGVRLEDREKLFDRFNRVESSHTRHISGFGIGLYLSAEIVGRHQGRIWLDSESGKGSTFYFTVPLN